MTSAQRQNGRRFQRVYATTASVPVMIPPWHAEAGDARELVRAVGLARDGQDRRDGVVLVELPLVDDVVQPPADERRDADDHDPVVDVADVEARGTGPRG